MGEKKVFSENSPYLALGTKDLGLKLILKKSTSERKSKQILATAETDRILYSLSTSAFKPLTNFNYYLAIIPSLDDFKESKISIWEPKILSGLTKTIKNLNAQIYSTVTHSTPSANANIDYRTAQTQLGEAFGTKKRKQAITSHEKNQINIQQLESSSSNFISRSIDSKSALSSRTPTPIQSSDLLIENSFMPPFNPNVDSIEMAFPNIVPEVLYADIENILPLSSFFSNYQVSDFLLPVRGKIVADHIAFRCIYLNFLISLFKVSENQINDNDSIRNLFYGLSENSINFFMTHFTEDIYSQNGSKRTKITPQKKDRLLSYISVLALSIDCNWHCNINQLSLSLKVPLTKISLCMKSIGCQISDSTSLVCGAKIIGLNGKAYPIKIASLKAPIVLPKQKKKNY